MDRESLARARKIIREAPWKVASSAAYRSSPHSYIIAMRSGPEWREFAGFIKTFGTYRTWHGHKYKYLIIDSNAFWIDFPALNKAPADTLDPIEPGHVPAPSTRAKFPPPRRKPKARGERQP